MTKTKSKKSVMLFLFFKTDLCPYFIFLSLKLLVNLIDIPRSHYNKYFPGFYIFLKE